MSYQAIIIVLALALLLSGVAEQADNDLYGSAPTAPATALLVSRGGLEVPLVEESPLFFELHGEV